MPAKAAHVVHLRMAFMCFASPQPQRMRVNPQLSPESNMLHVPAMEAFRSMQNVRIGLQNQRKPCVCVGMCGGGAQLRPPKGDAHPLKRTCHR